MQQLQSAMKMWLGRRSSGGQEPLLCQLEENVTIFFPKAGLSSSMAVCSHFLTVHKRQKEESSDRSGHSKVFDS